MGGDGSLLAPPIVVDSSVRFSLANSATIVATNPNIPQQNSENGDPSSSAPSSSGSRTRQNSHASETTVRRPSTNDTTYLSIHQGSIDGETLRSRANSFNSNTDTLRGSTAQKYADDYDDVPLEKALEPEKRNEQDFHVENNPFAFSPGQLNKMLNPKSLSAFRALGGLGGLERGLRTDLTAGLSVDESRLDGTVTFDEATHTGSGKPQPNTSSGVSASPSESAFVDRIRVFQRNVLPERKADGFLILFWRAYNDKIIILLTIAAVISLALGLYETFSGQSNVDWIEGVAICVAILIVTLVTAGNDWQKERQFVKLNRRVRINSIIFHNYIIRNSNPCKIEKRPTSQSHTIWQVRHDIDFRRYRG